MNSPYIDPATGDYVLVNGNILNKNAILTQMTFALKCPKGQYIDDPTFGSEIQARVGTGFVTNKRTLELDATNALNFLVSDGTIKKLSVICTFYSGKRSILDIKATLINNEQIYLPWEIEL